MSQMQQSNGADYFTTIRGLTSPLGTDLSDSSLQSLYPYLGNIALDKTRGSIFYGANNVWNGLVTGPVGPVTDGSIVIFDGTTGQFIEDTGITITNGTELNGVTLINGQPPPVGTNTGDVVMTTFGAAPNANAATITALPGPAFGQQLQLQPASATFPGGVSTGSQAFAGLKDFSASGIRLQPNPISGGGITTLNSYERITTACTFSGAIGYVNVVNVVFEKIGNIVMVTIPTGINIPADVAVQVDGFINSAVGNIPLEFRPAVDQLVSGVMVAYATAPINPPDNITTGGVTVLTTGTFQFCQSVGTDGLAKIFTGNASAGGRPGVLPGNFMYYAGP